jgi:hypothetical protein
MISLNDDSVKGRIREGALCGLSYEQFYWPHVPEHLRQDNFSADRVFAITSLSLGCSCWADGYGGGTFGRPGKYGNGAILVYNQRDIIEVKDEQNQVHGTAAPSNPEGIDSASSPTQPG